MCLARKKQAGISTKPGLTATAWIASAEGGLAEAGPQRRRLRKPARGRKRDLLGGLRGPSKRAPGIAAAMLPVRPLCGGMLRLPLRIWRCSVG
jgi:hypothetical protein